MLPRVPAVVKVKVSAVALLEAPTFTEPSEATGGGVAGAVFTVRNREFFELKLPEVPVIVIVAVPSVAELLAVSVRTLVPVVEVGLKDAVTPEGSPDAVRLTLPANPSASVTETLVVDEEPCATGTLAGESVNQKPEITDPATALMRLGQLGLPHPVTRSYPVTALYQTGWLSVLLFPVVMS
jgi:hypothetical protein